MEGNVGVQEMIAWLRMLVARIERFTLSPVGKEYLTLEEASKLTSIPESTLREKIRQGKLPAFKPAKTLLIKWSDLRAFIEDHPVVATPLTKPHDIVALPGSSRTKKIRPVRRYPR